MTRYKMIFVLAMFLVVVGCTAQTSSTKPSGGLQPKERVNCATLEPMTSEEYQYCNSGSQ